LKAEGRGAENLVEAITHTRLVCEGFLLVFSQESLRKKEKTEKVNLLDSQEAYRI